jgi:hypothetical protein
LERGRETGPLQKGEDMAETPARKEWTKENTTFVGLKLNNRTDKDILEALEGKPKQTEIKRLIRQGMKQDPSKR